MENVEKRCLELDKDEKRLLHGPGYDKIEENKLYYNVTSACLINFRACSDLGRTSHLKGVGFLNTRG